MKNSSRLIGISSEKDQNSVITYCNDVFAEYAGLKSVDQVLGKTDQDFSWQDYAEIYRAHELDALSGNNYSTIIPLKSADGDDLLFLHTKIQKTDANGKVTGIICRAIEILNQDALKLAKSLGLQCPAKKAVYHFGKKIGAIELSRRQKEILFLLTRGKSPKHIATIFSLSVRTVEYYIDIIRQKLGCHTRWELIDVALKEGFCDALPLNRSAKEMNDMITI